MDFQQKQAEYIDCFVKQASNQKGIYVVQFVAGKELRLDQLGNMIQTLNNWLATSDNLLVSIQEKIKWADTVSELDKKHRKVEERVEGVKKSLTLKKSQTVSGPTLTYEGMRRSTLNLVE